MKKDKFEPIILQNIRGWEGEAKVVLESQFNKYHITKGELPITHDSYRMLAKSMFNWSEDPEDWKFVFICDCEHPFDATKPFEEWRAFYINEGQYDFIISLDNIAEL